MTYFADEAGYHADVKYEGVQHFPSPDQYKQYTPVQHKQYKPVHLGRALSILILKIIIPRN